MIVNQISTKNPMTH